MINHYRFVCLLFFILCNNNSFAETKYACSGPECNRIDNIGQYTDAFNKEYLPALNKDIISVNAFTSAFLVPYPVRLDRFIVGTTFAYGYTDKTDVYLDSDIKGNIDKKLPVLGIAFNTTFYGGINLGWIFASWYNVYYDIFKCSDANKCNSQYMFPVLSRISLYMFGLGNDNNIRDKNTKTLFNRGSAIRILFIEERRFFGNMFKFDGLSGGIGFAQSKTAFKIDFNDTIDVSKYLLWEGNNKIEYYTDSRTVFGDVRTGISLLEFVSIYAGFGRLISSTNMNISLQRDGMISYNNNLTTYYLDMSSAASNSINNTYAVAGVYLGPITIQGARTYGINSLNNKHTYAIVLGITFKW